MASLFPAGAVAGSLPVSFFSVEKEKGGGLRRGGFGRKVETGKSSRPS